MCIRDRSTRACVIVYGFGYVRRRRRPDIVNAKRLSDVYCSQLVNCVNSNACVCGKYISVSYTHLDVYKRQVL